MGKVDGVPQGDVQVQGRWPLVQNLFAGVQPCASAWLFLGCLLCLGALECFMAEYSCFVGLFLLLGSSALGVGQWDATEGKANTDLGGEGGGPCAGVHSGQARQPGVSLHVGCTGPAGGVAEAANYLVRSSPPGWGPECVGLVLLLIALSE